MKEYDFDYYMSHPEEDNHADEYYTDDMAYIYCDECDNLMVPIDGGYKCPVCGCTKGSLLFQLLNINDTVQDKEAVLNEGLICKI